MNNLLDGIVGLYPTCLWCSRALTTVANSYIRPNVATYIQNVTRAVGGTRLSILRSDGGKYTSDGGFEGARFVFSMK